MFEKTRFARFSKSSKSIQRLLTKKDLLNLLDLANRKSVYIAI